MSPAFFFFLRIALAILDLLWFHINFRIICSSSVKNVIGNLIEITLNLQIALGSMVILTVLSLPIQEYGLFFHFFESSSVSFPYFRLNILEKVFFDQQFLKIFYLISTKGLLAIVFFDHHSCFFLIVVNLIFKICIFNLSQYSLK